MLDFLIEFLKLAGLIAFTGMIVVTAFFAFLISVFYLKERFFPNYKAEESVINRAEQIVRDENIMRKNEEYRSDFD